MKKLVLLALVVLIAGTFAFAEGQKEKGGMSGDYAFGGSTTVDPIITAAIEEWKSIHPDVHISYEGVGSSNGVKGVISGQYSLGAASREPKSSEKDQGVHGIHIALDAIAPVVNQDTVTISNLSVDQLAQIYAGEITSWSAVGGPDQEIVVFNRDEASGTYETFEKKVLGDREFTQDAGVVTSNGDMAAKVGATPYAIGYVGLGFVEEPGLKAVNVDSVEPTIQNVYNESYPIWRFLNVVFHEDAGLGEVEAAFVEYLLGDEGQSIVEEEGFIALPDNVISQAMDTVESAAE
jgi:phosphate transport system substrate-binding protein